MSHVPKSHVRAQVPDMSGRDVCPVQRRHVRAQVPDVSRGDMA
jgi:hypothetical protein